MRKAETQGRRCKDAGGGLRKRGESCREVAVYRNRTVLEAIELMSFAACGSGVRFQMHANADAVKRRCHIASHSLRCGRRGQRWAETSRKDWVGETIPRRCISLAAGRDGLSEEKEKKRWTAVAMGNAFAVSRQDFASNRWGGGQQEHAQQRERTMCL